MAGTLFGLGLSQQFDVNGDALSGCLLHIYLANSSSPRDTFKDVNLTPGFEHPWPIVADSTGRIPAFWVPDGSYRAELRTASGVLVFNETNMLAIGPSTGTGGPPPTVPAESLLQTGDVKWQPRTGNITGWVRMNGQTYGPSGSGGDVTGPAATHKALFLYIWNNISNPSGNVICPVSPSKGSDAESDWTAGTKVIFLPDFRGRSPFGVDDMGVAAAGRIGSTVAFDQGSAIVPGSAGGRSQHTTTAPQMPVHQHDAFIRETAHLHFTGGTAATRTTTLDGGGGGNIGVVGDPAATFFSGGNYRTDAVSTGVKVNSISGGTIATDNVTAAAGGTTGVTQPHPTLSPFVLGTWYMRQ
jgi:hypothetical protein